MSDEVKSQNTLTYAVNGVPNDKKTGSDTYDFDVSTETYEVRTMLLGSGEILNLSVTQPTGKLAVPYRILIKNLNDHKEGNYVRFEMYEPDPAYRHPYTDVYGGTAVNIPLIQWNKEPYVSNPPLPNQYYRFACVGEAAIIQILVISGISDS